MTLDCDVLVVGAGPAGSSAARAAAISGAKTIFIDKKREIGVPVQCAESISKNLIPLLPFKIPNEQLLWRTNGISFWVEDISVNRIGKFWSGTAISREKFDKWLAGNAVNSGAKLLLNTKLINLEFSGDYNVTKAVVETAKGEKEIRPKAIVAADGVDSTVLKLLDLFNPSEGTFAEVYTWEMDDLNLTAPHLEQVFVGDFTPSGYAYIFPKSKKRANVGVGGIFPKNELKSYFDEFLKIKPVKKQVKDAKFIIEKSGRAPFGKIVDEWVFGNVLIVGDAASHNLKPFIEGILPSIICGNIAGKVAAISEDKNAIRSYSNQIYDTIGSLFSDSYKLMDQLYEVFKMEEEKKYLLAFGLAADIFSTRDLSLLRDKEYDEIKKLLQNQLKKFS